jgi:hypothetical protein
MCARLLTPSCFRCACAQDMLLEHALVYGEYKGIPRQQVRRASGAWPHSRPRQGLLDPASSSSRPAGLT